jgi:Gas vesicle synthesis protein GvpL/GvpF
MTSTGSLRSTSRSTMTSRESRPDVATYVFCLVQSPRRPSRRGVPAGVPGAGTPRLIPIDRDVWAVVADAPLDRFAADQLRDELQDVEAISRHAVAHASVIEFFFRRAPVIPLKLFTVFSSDDRVREHLQSRVAGLRALFARLRGLEEWGVRVIVGPPDAELLPSLSSGRDYLQVKKRLNAGSAAPRRGAVKDANDALKRLGRLAAKLRKGAFPPPGRGRVFMTGASFLVKARRRNQWEKEVTKLSAALAIRGHRLEVTGPWPPYHFVSK